MFAFKRILVPYDGSEVSTLAVEAAARIAHDAGGRILLLHVLDELEYVDGYQSGDRPLIEWLRDQARKILDRAGAICSEAGVPVETRIAEHPGSRLGDRVAQAAADWEADLVVVGSHGRRGLSRALLGSGAEQIIRFARAPVLLVKETGTRPWAKPA